MHWRDALSKYAEKYESHCTGFTQAVLQYAGRDNLLAQQGPTKHEFIAYLEDGLVERDFREMF